MHHFASLQCNYAVYIYGANEKYGFLSNFYAAPIEVGGSTWPTTEHYYQAQKFSDPKLQEAIRDAATPGVAKKLAWSDSTGLRSDWDTARDDVMLVALRAKFTQHPDLRALLLATGDALLVEHTHLDHYWADGGDGSGQNRLGLLLMQVREELREAGAQGPAI